VNSPDLKLEDVQRAMPSNSQSNEVAHIYSLTSAFTKRFSSYGPQDYLSSAALNRETPYSAVVENKVS